jgi:hypothetical protein
MIRTKRIYIFSGLGADERVFQRLDLHDFSIVYIKWIVPQDKDVLDPYFLDKNLRRV